MGNRLALTFQTDAAVLRGGGVRIPGDASTKTGRPLEPATAAVRYGILPERAPGRKRNSISRARSFGLVCGLLLICAPGAGADNDPGARFRGAPTYDLEVTNLSWEPGTKDYSTIRFDLSWGHSWRAKWIEPASNNVTGKDLEIENWDAAWVFVKFRPEKNKKESIERNHWQHATLSTAESDHVMPAGATNTVGTTGDGGRGLGLFIYRDAVGQGSNTFSGVKLRWMHGSDRVDPTLSLLAVHAIAMVYVPEGPFYVGGGASRTMPTFLPGLKVPVIFGGSGILTDGAWHGGPLIPFLVDAEWNEPASALGQAAADTSAASRARHIGPFAGHLWGSLFYAERMAGGASVGQAGVLNDDFPTGYDAFYLMKYPLTQGQYADFLNALPPDVAATRAFVGGDADDPENAGGRIVEVKVDLGPEYLPQVLNEPDGYTIYSSFALSGEAIAIIPMQPAGGVRLKVVDEKVVDENQPKDPILEMLKEETLVAKKDRPQNKPKLPPVYVARLPFRRANYLSSRDYFSYAVWAGLRPMSELEYEKAHRGPLRDALVGVSKDQRGHPPLLDEGLPTERYASGNHPAGDFASRVGSFATATSDQDSAGATYWGILDFSHAQVVPLTSGRGFRGTLGDGRTPAGIPGASIKRSHGPILDTAPADWPPTGRCGTKAGSDRVWVSGEHMGDSRKASNFGWLVGAAKPRLRANASASLPEAREQTKRLAEQPASLAEETMPSLADTVRVRNVRWEAGTKDYSTVTFDLAWDDSWRAVWTEPAEKNVTGKPLQVESWDAAWVFVKFRMPDSRDDLHATLSTVTADHHAPAGAAIDVGLDDYGERGIGVFIYRSAAGRGSNTFRNVKLRWMHAADLGADGTGTFDPDEIELKPHAVEMVYVPRGPFKSKSPWGVPLTLINTDDATKPGGYVAATTNEVPLQATWPNGYKAFYCMKHAISQGQYTDLLNSQTSNHNGGRYSAGTYWCRTARYDRRLYGVNGFSITTNAAGRYQADAPDRACNMLSWPDILSYTAWAGLRMPTNLEYEKACRGPREVARDEDAWTAETCAPAPAVASHGVSAGAHDGYGPSYWNIRGLSLSGIINEWPGLFQSVWGISRSYMGSHGNGTSWAPGDWPWTSFGDHVAKGQWFGTENNGIWIDPFQMNRAYAAWEAVDADRTGRFGARAARTAPGKEDLTSPLRIDRLPKLFGYDAAFFYLTGHFKNTGDQALKVELVTAFPDTCFPDGAASRVFTAPPPGRHPVPDCDDADQPECG